MSAGCTAHSFLVAGWVHVCLQAPRHGVGRRLQGAGCKMQGAGCRLQGAGLQAEGAHEVDADMTTTATKVDMAPWKTAEPV